MKNEIDMSVIVAARKKAKLSQEDMAKLLGVKVRAYRNKEKGNLKLHELITICKRLDVSVLIVDGKNILK